MELGTKEEGKKKHLVVFILTFLAVCVDGGGENKANGNTIENHNFILVANKPMVD